MLVLSRKLGEQILIDSGICITVVSVKGNRVTLGIDAPKHVRVDRSELAARVASERVATPVANVIEPLSADGLVASFAG